MIQNFTKMLNLIISMRFVCTAGFVLIFLSNGFSQSPEWQLEKEKGVVHKTISIPGKSAKDIYKGINRWLISFYKNPEDILKARLEDEYLRGEGYHPNVCKSGSVTSADLRYTFSFQIKDEEITLKIYDAYLIYPNSQDENGEYPIENYMVNDRVRKKKNSHSEMVMASVTEFSNSLILTVENSLTSNKQ